MYFFVLNNSIKKLIADTFPSFKFIFTTNKVQNVFDINEQLQIIWEIHNRAHRSAKNNYVEAQRLYFWPKIKNDFPKNIKTCEICKMQKYERIPTKQPIGSTPIPAAVGESISMDIFHIDNKLYVTSIDRSLLQILNSPFNRFKIKFS